MRAETTSERFNVQLRLSGKARVPSGQPLRPIRPIVDQMLVELSPEFDRVGSRVGRRSVAPEQGDSNRRQQL